MTRSENKEQIDKIPLQSAKHLAQELFLAAVSAAAENDCSLFQAEVSQDLTRQFGVNFYVLGIELNAAKRMNPLRINAERFPSFNILRILDTNRVKHPKCR